MAKTKTAAEKKLPAKKSSKRGSLGKLSTEVNNPLKIIVEVVIRNETYPGHDYLSKSSELLVENSPNFSYSFEKQNASILTLVVGSYESSNPADSGNFFTRVFSKEIPVIVYAQQDRPNAFAYLTLKYNGKDIYVPPRTIAFKGGKGQIDETVIIP